MKTKKRDAAHVLRVLAHIRKSVPVIGCDAPRLEGIGSLLAEFSAATRQKRARVNEAALQIYYDTEALSRDPENAHLVPYVQRMREAYERDYGRPIPPKMG